MKNLLIPLLLLTLAISGCKKDWTKDHEGHYIGTTSCTNGIVDNNAFVTLTAIDEMTLEGDDGMRFEMTSESRFDIPQQTLSGVGHVGSGYFTSNGMKATFTVTPSGQSSFNCTFNGSK